MYTKDPEVLQVMVRDAERSARLFRTETHVEYGTRVVYLTDLEVADARERTSAEVEAGKRRDGALAAAKLKLAAAGLSPEDLKLILSDL